MNSNQSPGLRATGTALPERFLPLDAFLRRHPWTAGDVMDEAANFKRSGELVVPHMPVAQKNDFAAILAINRMVERLTGRKISAHVHDMLAA